MRNNSLNEEFYDDLEVEDDVSSDIELDGKPFRKFVMFGIEFSIAECTHEKDTIKKLRHTARKLEYIVENSGVTKHSGVNIQLAPSGNMNFVSIDSYEFDFRYASRCRMFFSIDGYMKPDYVKTMMDYMFSDKNKLYVPSIGIYDYIEDDPKRYIYIADKGANFVMGSYGYNQSNDSLRSIFLTDMMNLLCNSNDIYPYYKNRNVDLSAIVKDTSNTKSTYKGKNKIVNPCQFD